MLFCLRAYDIRVAVGFYHTVVQVLGTVYERTSIR